MQLLAAPGAAMNWQRWRRLDWLTIAAFSLTSVLGACAGAHHARGAARDGGSADASSASDAGAEDSTSERGENHADAGAAQPQDEGDDAGESPDEPAADGGQPGPNHPDAPLPPLPPLSDGACAFVASLPTGVKTDNPNCPDGIYTGTAYYDWTSDNLRGCVRIRGDLRVVLRMQSDLAGLESIQVVEGNVGILNNCDWSTCRDVPALRSLRGLDNLRCITGNLSVGRDTQFGLETFDGLGQLVEVGGVVEITMPSVKPTDRFEGLRRVWGDVTSNVALPMPALETVYGKLSPQLYAAAPQLSYVGCDPKYVPCRDGYLGCAFEANSQAEVNRLGSCEQTRLGLTVSGLDVSDLQPLAHLRSVTTELLIGPDSGKADKLTSLKGLEALREVQTLTIRNLPELSDLRALMHLSSATPIRDVTLSGLSKLPDLTGLEALNWQAMHVQFCASLRSLDGLHVVEQAGTLELVDDAALEDLRAFAPARTLADLRLERLPRLSNLSGLTQLTHIGSLNLTGCNALQDLSVLGPVTELGLLQLVDDAELVSLPKVASGNAVLVVSLQGLPALANLNGLGPDSILQLHIVECNALNDLSGLDKVATIDEVSIQDNAKLTALSGVPALRSVTRVVIEDNATLASLRGFANIEAEQGTLVVEGNAQLPQCEVDSLAKRFPPSQTPVPGTNGPAGMCVPW